MGVPRMLLRATAGLAACLATHAVASVTVSLTAPTNGSVHQAGVNVTLSATATASKGYTLSKVEFYQGTTLIGGDTSAPYSIVWNSVPAGNYSLTAKAIATKKNKPDQTALSATVNVTVNATAALLHFIHVDHLNTPRLVANQSGQTVWRWDQQEPFGNSAPDGNPSGLGTFDFPQRFPGQYLDKETDLHYNYFRDYNPNLGRYGRSDPIGLRAGINTYAYVLGNPLSYMDPFGLDIKVCYYYDAAGGFGHVGYGVGSEARTSGYYPTGKAFGSPGIVREDEQQLKECKIIPSDSEQDQCMLDCRARRATDPGFYNLTTNQCTRFVRDCLNECGLPTGSSSGSAPRPLFLRLPGRVQ